eukprot:TRINITY_DN2269_c0_g2_i1.p1 TRINITY_DN2269_c0_g2~~TRINITY_DN2269_c0_g2_i1.p1  ORF type:complete len:320 (+),score=55.67 TRINITY_DN2269_c0_g2_i1:66-1025(+)
MAAESQRQPLFVQNAQNMQSAGPHQGMQQQAFFGQPAPAPRHSDAVPAFGNKLLTMQNQEKHSRNEIDFYEHFMVYTEWPRHCCCVDLCLPPAYVKQVIPKFRITSVQFSKDKPAAWKLGLALFFFCLAALLLIAAFLSASSHHYPGEFDPTLLFFLLLLICLILGGGFLVWANISKGVHATFAVTGYEFSGRTSSGRTIASVLFALSLPVVFFCAGSAADRRDAWPVAIGATVLWLLLGLLAFLVPKCKTRAQERLGGSLEIKISGLEHEAFIAEWVYRDLGKHSMETYHVVAQLMEAGLANPLEPRGVSDICKAQAA